MDIHDGVQHTHQCLQPYPTRQELIARVAASPLARLVVLGDTLDGRPVEMLTMGTGPRKVWIVARQHPGESMAEWLAQGILDKLLDDSAESQVSLPFPVLPPLDLCRLHGRVCASAPQSLPSPKCPPQSHSLHLWSCAVIKSSQSHSV